VTGRIVRAEAAGRAGQAGRAEAESVLFFQLVATLQPVPALLPEAALL
jgi:hypothetical protein